MTRTRTSPPQSVELDIDAEGAYAFLTDLAFLPEWYPGISAVSLAPADVRVRQRFVEHRQLAPGLSVGIELTVTAADPGREFSVVARRRGIGRVEGTYRFETLGDDACRVTVSHSVRPAAGLLAPVAAAIDAFIAHGDRAQVAAMPDGLARWRGA